MHRTSSEHWQKTLNLQKGKRARNSPHNWVEQKGKKKRERETERKGIERERKRIPPEREL